MLAIHDAAQMMIAALVVMASMGCSEESVIDLCPEEPPACRDDTFGYLGFRATDTEASWSPDGSDLAYFHGGVTELGDTSGLYIVSPQGADNRLLLAGLCGQPDWSPDGSWLAFCLQGRLYRMSVDDQTTMEILALPTEKSWPRWSPDGSSIVYSCSAGENRGIWVVPSDSQDPMLARMLIQPGEYPGWSHAGTHIVFLGYLPEGTGISIMDSSGANACLVFQADSPPPRYPAFSPDDSQIAFSYAASGHVPQVWVIGADGTGARQLTTCGGLCPVWSPDGNKIVYTDTRRCNGRLWIMNADGSGKRQVTLAEWWSRDE